MAETVATANRFDERVTQATGARLHAERISTIQVNIGLTCNLSCVHCHVSSSPRRKEQMDWDTMEQVLRVARDVGASVIDITGGAPEMNPHFRRFVSAAREAGHEAMVRTNLTILLERGYEDLPEFFASKRVHLVASLPCYTRDNVDRQRGEGVYDGSIEAMRRLNAIGYGVRPELALDLMYNPGGASLPGDQATLEADYRRELGDRFGLSFTHLYTITNMAIGRFATELKRASKADAYRELLERSFNPATIEPLMCRHQIDVDWNGTIYDCDFNLALKLPAGNGRPRTIRDFDAGLHRRKIATGDHCFGCTAGSGSSCGGSLV
jgi:radical SAM/Cys-rich protein